MKSHSPDCILIVILFLLVLLGLMILGSASSVIAYQKFQDSFFYLKHQLLYGILPGLILFYLCSKIKYQFWQKIATILILFNIGLLVAVFLPKIGFGTAESRRWIKIGGVLFQPSELLKLILPIYLAAWAAKIGPKIKTWSYGFLPFLILIGIVSGLIIVQPDIGTLFIILIIALIVYFISRARILHLFVLAGGALSMLFLLIKLAPYRMARLISFINPQLDPQGIGYHISQARLAIGSGGLFGVGLGHSRQKFLYLPEVFSDSIFAVIAEELGFIITAGIIILFIFLIYRGLKIARGSPDDFGRILAVGIVSWIVFQMAVNMGAMLGLTPVTGLPLPFISYGGSAMTVSLAAMGILVNISKQTEVKK